MAITPNIDSGQSVLSGPKTPCWGCRCGADGNWASRLKCRECYAPCPTSVRNKAEAEAKKGKGKWSGWGKGYNHGGTAWHGWQSAWPAVRGGAGNKSGLGQAIEALRPFPELKEEMDRLIATDAKQKQDSLDTKPLSQQLQGIEALVAKKQKAATFASTSVDKCKEALDKASLKLDEARAHQTEVDKELADLRAQLQAKATRASESAADPSAALLAGLGSPPDDKQEEWAQAIAAMRSSFELLRSIAKPPAQEAAAPDDPMAGGNGAASSSKAKADDLAAETLEKRVQEALRKVLEDGKPEDAHKRLSELTAAAEAPWKKPRV
jgi:hypothetical protein